MGSYRATIWSIVIFIVAAIFAAYLQQYYQSFIRFLFKTLQGDRIQFFGKAIFLSPSYLFVVSFGIFCVIQFNILRKLKRRTSIINLASAVLLFIMSTMIVSYIGSSMKVFDSNIRRDGIRMINMRALKYDLFFIISLSVTIVPAIYSSIRTRKAVSH